MADDGKLRVLILGCGNIAGKFDAERPADALPLSHAGAYSRHGGFELAACVDPEADARQGFMQRWGVGAGYAHMRDIPADAGFDVISVCSPTRFHNEHLEAAIALRPGLIFCEKPVTTTLAETERRVSACEKAGIMLAVNYTRRWAPDIRQLRDDLQAGVLGEVRSVICTYNKGILNNGGHMIDLLHHLFGPLKVISTTPPVWDFWDDDPTVGALLETRDGVPVHLATAHAGDYALFEMQLITSKAVITMEEGGMSWRIRNAIESPHFRGYKALAAGEMLKGTYPAAMQNAISNIYDALTKGANLASTGLTAMKAQSQCEEIKLLAMGN